jgi:hypothetical protein
MEWLKVSVSSTDFAYCTVLSTIGSLAGNPISSMEIGFGSLTS